MSVLAVLLGVVVILALAVMLGAGIKHPSQDKTKDVPNEDNQEEGQ